MEQKLNIVMFGHKRIPSREGGIEIVVEELATRMVERGHQVTVLNRRGKHVSGGEVEKVNEYKSVCVKTVATIDKKGLAAMTSSFTAAVKAAVSKTDVVHIHAEGPAAMCWIPKLADKRVICTIHGDAQIISRKKYRADGGVRETKGPAKLTVTSNVQFTWLEPHIWCSKHKQTQYI